jgi:branched-chain amino acid transport system substrate-binding protein
MVHVRRRLAITTLVGTVLLGAVAGCASDRAGPAAARDPIRLGALIPLSGTNAQSGREMRDGAQLAVREANDAGGVLGRPVELIVGDDGCDPGTAVVEANRLVEQGIAVSVGGYCSSATVPTLKIFRTAGIPMVIALSNSTDLLEPGYDSVFLISGTVAAEGVFALAWMKRLGSTRLAIVHDGTSFPVTLADAAAASAAKPDSGVTLVGQFALSQGASNYTRIAGQVIASGSDTIYFTGYYGEANRLILDLRTAGYQGKIIVGDGSADGPLLKGITVEQSKDVYATALMVPELMPGLADWSSRFTAATGRAPASSGPEAYDAVRLAIDAIGRAGTVEHEAVRQALAATTDLELLSGRAQFNPDGTRTNPTFLFLAVREGRFVELPPAPSSTP